MANNKMRKLQAYYDAKYDSDEDLDPKVQEKIKDAPVIDKEKIREDAWDKADLYPKLKRVVKGAWYGDKRK